MIPWPTGRRAGTVVRPPRKGSGSTSWFFFRKLIADNNERSVVNDADHVCSAVQWFVPRSLHTTSNLLQKIERKNMNDMILTSKPTCKKKTHQRNKSTTEWTNEGMKEWRNEGTNEWTNERTHERTNERKNERTNERKNERMNEWMHSWTIEEINPRLFIGSTGNGFYRCCSWRYTVALVAERLWKTQVQGAHRFKNGRLFVFHVFCYSHLRVTLWKNCFRTPVKDIK